MAGMSDTPRGYEPHNPTSPTLSLDGVTWVPLRIVPPGDPKFIEWVANMAAERARLRPWTLVSLRGEVPLVAVRRTLWWRLVTAWHNVGRRFERRRIQALAVRRSRELTARLVSGSRLNDGTSVTKD